MGLENGILHRDFVLGQAVKGFGEIRGNFPEDVEDFPLEGA
jgi:hypothetical protein